MKIEDLLVQSQVDEGIGSAIGKGIGAVSRGIGAVASVPQGIGRAIKKGYQGGVATIGGDAPAGTAPAGTAPAGTAAPAQTTTTQAAPAQGGFGAGLSNLGASLAGATGVPTASNGGAAGVAPAGTNAAAADNTAGAANVSPLQDKKFMGSLQALKGGDVEKVRAVLKSRAAVAEGLDEGPRWDTTKDFIARGGQKALAGGKWAKDKTVKGAKWAKDKTVQGVNAAGQAIANAPDTLGTVAGKVGGAGTRFSQAYQNARGGYMTIQDLQRSIAAMSPKDAGEALQFFNSIHPDATAAAPAAGTDAGAGPGDLKVVDGGKAVAQEGIDELASMKNMLDILKKR